MLVATIGSPYEFGVLDIGKPQAAKPLEDLEAFAGRRRSRLCPASVDAWRPKNEAHWRLRRSIDALIEEI